MLTRRNKECNIYSSINDNKVFDKDNLIREKEKLYTKNYFIKEILIMKTLKSIINAVLILLMAIYGLAMLALLILPFVDVTNLFPGAEVHYLSGWGYWLVSKLQFAFYLALICLLRKEFKDFTWKAILDRRFFSLLEKGCSSNLCAISLELSSYSWERLITL